METDKYKWPDPDREAAKELKRWATKTNFGRLPDHDEDDPKGPATPKNLTEAAAAGHLVAADAGAAGTSPQKKRPLASSATAPPVVVSSIATANSELAAAEAAPETLERRFEQEKVCLFFPLCFLSLFFFLFYILSPLFFFPPSS